MTNKYVRWFIIIFGTASIALPPTIIGWTYHPLLGIAAGILAAGGVFLPSFLRRKVHKN